jgi:hypothetical protein
MNYDFLLFMALFIPVGLAANWLAKNYPAKGM